MSIIRRNIPNLFTAGNLLGGILAIVCIFNGFLALATLFVVFSALMDFADGFVARLLKVQSELGKQLDSLADMVTFGLVPGLMVFVLILFTAYEPSGYSVFQSSMETIISQNIDFSCGSGDLFINRPGANGELITTFDYRIIYSDQFHFPYIAFLLPICAMFRLAKFNLDDSQSDGFKGLPTPAMTIFFLAIPMVVFGNSSTVFASDLSAVFLLNPWFLSISAIIMSILMVVNLPLFALKFKSFGWKGNEIRYIFLTISVGLLATLFWWALPIIIVLYIILSLINNLISKSSTNEIQS